MSSEHQTLAQRTRPEYRSAFVKGDTRPAPLDTAAPLKSKASGDSKGFSAQNLLRSPALQIAAYFLLLSAVLVVLGRMLPEFRQLFIPGAATSPASGGLDLASGSPEAFGEVGRTALEVGITGLLVMVGALIFVVPVARMYVVTKRQEGYAKSFIRLLLALPVVVAAVVQIVQNDLALAFALTGIVAAMRFRATVEDLQDAFFAFSAIAIGLASGTGNFMMAGVTSAVVTGLVYTLWRYNVGEVESSMELSHTGGSLTEALVPGEVNPGVTIGSEERAVRVDLADRDRVQQAIARVAGFVRADALRGSGKYNTLCVAHVVPDEAEAAAKGLEKVLDEFTRRWVLVEMMALHDPEVLSFAYLARLRKDVDIGKMVGSFHCSSDGPLYAVELKPISGLRARLT